MKYILSDQKGEGCIFCPGDDRGEDEERLVLYFGELTMVMMNRFPLEELQRAGRKVMIGLEMYPYTEQEFLDQWSAGQLTESGFLELSRASRTTDYNVTLVILDLDPETGEGTGTVIGGAELSVEEETGQLHIEIAGHRPTELKKVKRLPIKKKD